VSQTNDLDDGGLTPSAWLLLSIEGRRQYGGNTGYADVPGQIYRFDSLVANARHVATGDVVVFRDRSGGTGFAKVESISAKEGSKQILRCPECNAAQIKERTTIRPRFRCKRKHEFDTPLREDRNCTEYEARFGNTFVPADPPIPVNLLRGACQRFNGQLSIQRISLGILAPFVSNAAPKAISLLGLGDWDLLAADAWNDEQTERAFVPSGQDARESVFRQIRARRGQKQFRDALLERYGPRCLISECDLVDVLEAAHNHPYRSKSDNDPANGLILRCDLHTLFDVDLLGVEPKSLVIRVDPRAAECGYSEYDGLMLQCKETRPSESALNFRWELYLARQTGVMTD